MIASTAFTVAFSPAHAVRGGCSVSFGRYHDTAGSLPAAASVSRFDASTTWLSRPGTGFDWGSVRGLTLAGGDLYLARADGTLWTAGWNPGLEHGSPVNGSLTLVDNDPSQMWASRGMFVRN